MLPNASKPSQTLPNPPKSPPRSLLSAKNEPKASKMTPKWSPNGSLVGIKKTLCHHLDKKVPTSTKPNYLLCFVKIHHLFQPLNFDAFWFPKPIKKWWKSRSQTKSLKIRTFLHSWGVQAQTLSKNGEMAVLLSKKDVQKVWDSASREIIGAPKWHPKLYWPIALGL